VATTATLPNVFIDGVHLESHPVNGSVAFLDIGQYGAELAKAPLKLFDLIAENVILVGQHHLVGARKVLMNDNHQNRRGKQGSKTEDNTPEDGVAKRFNDTVVLKRLLVKDEFFASHKIVVRQKIITAEKR
jgi:hypothetical protein